MRPGELQLEHGSFTHVGRVRERNEDFLTSRPEKRLFIVADGIGGHEGGAEAARRAVNLVAHRFRSFLPVSLTFAVQHAHASILRENQRTIRRAEQQNPKITSEALMRKMRGTTLSALHIGRNGNARFVHVGDSRIYRYSKGALRQVTVDHYDPRERIITQAVGINISPQEGEAKAKHGDVFLLCSDGLHSLVADRKIEVILKRVSQGDFAPDDASRLLIELANRAGGNDNSTALIVRVK